MLLGWFDAAESKRCGLALAEIVEKGYPASERKAANKAIVHRAKVLDKLFAQARQFEQAHNPNLYKKAKLGNAFRWRLIEEGFDAKFVHDLTHQIMVEMK